MTDVDGLGLAALLLCISKPCSVKVVEALLTRCITTSIANMGGALYGA